MNGKHLDLEKRKLIKHYLAHNETLSDMGKALGMDPTSISKEIKRNRYLLNESIPPGKECAKIARFPHVCNRCKNRYYGCTLRQYLYDAQIAQNKADRLLVESRKGINKSKEEFKGLDNAVKEGIDEGRTIYDIVNSSESITVSVQSVYRYINNNLLSVKRIDLPYAVTYKKRKRKEKKKSTNTLRITALTEATVPLWTIFPTNLIIPNVFCVQMDFLGSVVSDSKSILTLTIADLHFVLLFLIDKKNASKIVCLFDTLQNILGIETFKQLFPCILTDRDPSFSDYEGIEIDKQTGERRTQVFYCDPFKSNQKANVENMNHQLRRYFPKKERVNQKTAQDLMMVMNIINHKKTASLCGYCPVDAFIAVYGEETYKKLLTIFA